MKPRMQVLALAAAMACCAQADTVELSLTPNPPTTVAGGLQGWNFSLTNNSTKFLVVNLAEMDLGSFVGVVGTFTEMIAANLTIVDPGQTTFGAFGSATILATAPMGLRNGTFTLGYDLYVFHPIDTGISDAADEFGLFLNNKPATIQITAPSAVPEPSTALLWAGGLIAGALLKRRSRRSQGA